MYKIFLLLLLSICFELQAQDSIVVKLNLTDCHNCYGGFCSIEPLSSNIKTVLILRESDRDIAKKFITKQIGLSRNYSIVYSDSLFTKLNHVLYSEIYVYDRKELIYSSNLESFKFSSLTDLFKVDTLFTLPDTISLSKAKRITVNQNYMGIYDLIFNELTLIDLSKKKVIGVFNNNTYPIDSVYKYVHLDSLSIKLFNIAKPYLKTSQNDVCRLEGFCFTENNLMIAGNYPVMKRYSGDTVKLIPQNILFKYSLSNLKQFHTSQVENFNEDSAEFYPITRNILPIDSTRFIIRSVSAHHTKSYKLDVWNSKGTLVVRECTINSALPNYYLETGLKDNMLNEIVAYPYLFYSLSSEVINVETHDKFSLPLVNHKFKFSFDNADKLKFEFQIVNARYSNKSLDVMVIKNEEDIELIKIDASTFQTIKEIFLPKQIMQMKPILSFWTDHLLIGITKDNKIISISY